MAQKVVILVLCGLPGAGKTTFAKKLRETLLTGVSVRQDTAEGSEAQDITNVISEAGVVDTDSSHQSCHFCLKHVCYDKIITENVYSTDNWKVTRKDIVKSVEQNIVTLLGLETPDHSDIDPTVYNNYSHLTDFDIPPDSSSDGPVYIFIIDDNNFYQSMRYEYFQLARKWTIGFAEVYVKSTMEVSLERNSARTNPVAMETIKTMAAKFDPPNGNNSWERNLHVVSCSETCSDSTLQTVKELLQESADQPVQPLPEEDEERKSADRIVCSSSVIHQADQILRRVVQDRMTSETSSSKSSLQSLASNLNQAKNRILQQMKTESLLIPSSLESQVQNSSKDKHNPFFIHVTQLFHDHLK